MNKRKVKFKAAAACLACAMLLAANGLATVGNVSASASVAHYCDDTYNGQGTQTSTTYTIDFDYYVEHTEYVVNCAPSLNNGGTGTTNDCAVTAGTNVVAFYDRYYENLIPDYTPGITIGTRYLYFPNAGSEIIKSLHTTLYNYMATNVTAPGTSENGFKNGLSKYITEKGYNVTYSSIYKSGTTVDLTKMQQMIKNKQVAVLFLTGYNFINGITTTDTSRTIYQRASAAGHVMMVYGYLTVDYYKNNKLFLTETYLEASSCFSTSEQGYFKLNDYGTIDDAVIVAVS